jgi:Uncharacterized protein, possibly involved in aromatic compounds catabolism
MVVLSIFVASLPGAINSGQYPVMQPTDLQNKNPFELHFGYQLQSWVNDYVRIDVPLQDIHMNMYGRPHGGVYTSLLDSVMGLCGFKSESFEGMRGGLTLSCTINFLAAPQDQLLIGEGFRTGGGRNIYFAKGTVKDGLGNLLATGTGTFRHRDLPAPKDP